MKFTAIPTDIKDRVPSSQDIDALLRITTRFYNNLFIDKHLQKFVTDPSEPHALRLAKYIEEMWTHKKVWSEDLGRLGLRSKSHAKAWNCLHREPEKAGRRFKLGDCRMWMRLFFWAAREEGFSEGDTVFDYLFSFVVRFIPVYEYTAVDYVEADSRWSIKKRNLEQWYRSVEE